MNVKLLYFFTDQKQNFFSFFQKALLSLSFTKTWNHFERIYHLFKLIKKKWTDIFQNELHAPFIRLGKKGRGIKFSLFYEWTSTTVFWCDATPWQCRAISCSCKNTRSYKVFWMEKLDKPLHSPDLAPGDFHLFVIWRSFLVVKDLMTT